MPSFGLAGASDQQIWSMVAFIKNLPRMSDEDYKAWTASPEPSRVAASPEKVLKRWGISGASAGGIG